MAGIGFHLNKLVSGDTFTHAAAGYISSIVVTSGPWLTSVISLTLLSAAGIPSFTGSDFALLMATITYAFCASLILTGGPQMVISRYLADRLYVDDWQSIVPTCNGVLLLVAPLAAIASPFLLFAPFDWRYRLLVFTLFLTLCLMWLTSIFLSAARDFMKIVVIFAIGHGTSVAAAILLGRWAGLIGGLSGYTLGQAISTTLLIAQVYREFPPSDRIDLSFLKYWRQFWDLMALGTLFSVGIWADNLIHWFAPGHVVIAGFYHVHATYDMTKLLAYLTTIFASAMFLVHIETTFARHYRTFYRRIDENGTLAEIRQARQGMIASARAGLMNVLKLQLIVTGAVLLLAPDIVAATGLPDGSVRLLRVGAIAADSQFIMLVGLLLLLYLDQRRRALSVAALFVATNAGLTLLALLFGTVLDGTGYLVAATIAATAALLALWDGLRRLEYLTFMLQPITHPLAVTEDEHHDAVARWQQLAGQMRSRIATARAKLLAERA